MKVEINPPSGYGPIWNVTEECFKVIPSSIVKKGLAYENAWLEAKQFHSQFAGSLDPALAPLIDYHTELLQRLKSEFTGYEKAVWMNARYSIGIN